MLQCVASFATQDLNRSGPPGVPTSTYRCSRPLRTVGSARAWFRCPLSRFTTSAGVPAAANRPNHPSRTTEGEFSSLKVGTSGKKRLRWFEATASGLSRPAAMHGATALAVAPMPVEP